MVPAFLLALQFGGATLSPPSLEKFEVYMAEAEAEMSRPGPLWIESRPSGREAALRGEIVAGFTKGSGPQEAGQALIHDWTGSVYLAGVTRTQVLSVLQNYNGHSTIYAPDVVRSTLLKREDGVSVTRVRLRKKNFITVVLEAEFRSVRREITPQRTQIAIRSGPVQEVLDEGGKDERLRDADTGLGLLWRLHSWYTLEQDAGGVWLELRSVSLTREVPLGLGRIVGPLVNSLPRESLESTLRRTAAAVQALR